MYVIYIYDKNKNLLTQFFEISDLQITEKLNDVSTASFQIENKTEIIKYKTKKRASFFDLENKNFEENNWNAFNKFYVDEQKNFLKNYAKYKFLKEWNIVDIYKIYKFWEEKRLFYGLIKWVKSDLRTCEVRCVDFLYLLKKKCIFSSIKTKDFFKSPKEILENIKNEINSRDNNFIKKINCTLNEPWAWEFKAGKSIFDILKDFASDLYEFKFENGEIFLIESIWKNKTSWKDIVFFEYDVFSPESSNIAKAEIEYDLDNIFNYFLTKDWVWKSDESIANFWVLEKVDEKQKLEKLIEENAESLKEFKIEPTISDFFFCNIWDTVKVEIDNWTEMMRFDGNLKVVEKTYKSWDLETVWFKLNSSKYRTKNIFETISDLKSDVKNLKL